MKILELSPSLAPGGAERFTVDLANELAKTQDVNLLVMRKYKNSDFYRKELTNKVNHIQEKENYSFFSKLKQVFLTMFWIYKLKPDIVHGHTIAINWMIFSSLLFRKSKYYFTVHNMADQECTTRIGYILRKWLFKKHIRAITISQVCEESFEKSYGYHAFKMINNGCRYIHTTPMLEEVRKEIAGYKRTNNTTVFINVARIMPQKNHKLLIQSFNQYIAQEHDAVLLIVGDYLRFPKAKAELDSLIENDRIFFLGTRNNVSDYLAVADYFCLSSAWEGLPISLLEAGLSGCYPISTPAGGVKDVIINKSWGTMSTDFTIESYLKAIEQATQSSYIREDIKAYYSKKFLMDVCASEYLQAFTER